MQWRHEWKHEISPSDRITLRQRLSAVCTLDPHATNGSYHIRSLYFDNASDRALREKLDGVDRREKWRIRCYDGDTSLIHLERKAKANGLGTKDSCELTADEVRAIVEGDVAWMSADERPLVRRLSVAMTCEGMRPRVIVDYRREPYLFPAGNVRVTMDYNIRTGLSCTDFLDPACPTIPVPGDPIILEVNDKGELYKPDSMGFGGGRGNGREFDIQDVLSEQEGSDEDASGDNGGDAGSTGEAGGDAGGDAGGNAGANGFQPGSMPQSFDFGNAKDAGGSSEGISKDAGSGFDKDAGDFFKNAGAPGGGGFGGMSSSDVKLQYIDDDPDSYPNIFDNAKTDITNADKVRLIASLRKLSAGEDLESVLDMDEVLRYFVVHDFVCNGDSYTGTMVHNYYLRENDGQLSMIPWDYNLAFGGFSGGDATSLVNSPIDSPVSSGFGGFGQGRSSDGGDSSNQTASNENTADAGQQGEGDNAAQSPQGSQESQTMPQFPGGGDMSQAPSGGDMPQMLSGGDMPQMPSGVDMPQMSGGGNMQQALGGGQMPEFPGGGDTSQSSSDGSMPQAPGGGQMPEFSGSGDGSAPQFPGGGSMPQQPDGNQMPTSADGSTSFSPMEMFSSSASSDSRPMVDWIFSDEKYTERYHELYEEFLNSVDIQAIIDEAEALIDPYVERDPRSSVPPTSSTRLWTRSRSSAPCARKACKVSSTAPSRPRRRASKRIHQRWWTPRRLTSRRWVR